MGSARIFPANILAAAASDPLVVLDLGARGGIDEDLLPLAPAVIAIGFEPDPEESRRLQAAPKGPWCERRILSCAIAGRSGPATLHVPRAPEGASLLPHNTTLIEEFGHEGLHRTLRQIPIEALTLDDLADAAGIRHVDYLKIDVEGAELDVLQGGTNLAAAAKVMKIECAFIEQRSGQPIASDVISHLGRSGFDLIDIRAIQRWRRRPLPAHPYSAAFPMPYSRGRIAQADLFFLRRFSPEGEGRDVSAAMLILTATGYVDIAVTLLRRCPAAAAWWRERDVDIMHGLQTISRNLGKHELRQAIRKQLRGVVPLLKSRLGRLPFRQPEHEY